MYQKLLALATFTGTIIGVGLFGLPYVTAKIGFLAMLIYFIILSAVLIFINLMYGEIALRTAKNHRLPGYARIYLNPAAARLGYLTTFIGLTGSLLAYVLVGGEFLKNLLGPTLGGSSFLYATIFFAAGALIVYFGTGPVSKTELYSLGLFFVILFLLGLKAWPQINFQYFTTTDLEHFFLPYGVILFSLGGLAVIPEMKELLKGQESALKKLIIIGLVIPALTYLFFISLVFGVTGSQTTPEGLIGLNLALGDGIARLGFVFGIITTFTSFLTLGITLKKEFSYDGGLPAWLAWLLACGPAYGLFLLGLKDFIGIIGFIGSIALGFDIIIITLIYFKAKIKSQRHPAYQLKANPGLVFAMILLFLFGIILEIIHLLP